MMRYFNTHGPVNPAEHYFVGRNELVNSIAEQITRGKYFTIFAPRQTGKTTLLQSLESCLQEQSDFLFVSISFEAYESWSPAEFWADFAERIGYQIRFAVQQVENADRLEHLPLLAEVLTSVPFTNSPSFLRFFRQLYELLPKLKIILVIDEFDATPQAALSPLLQSLRTMYLDKRPPHSLHSVVLVGVQNIAQLNVGRSSPFNIAYQHHLESFTLDEVKQLLTQYSENSDRHFEPGVIEKLTEQSGGQPFLVNRTAALLVEAVNSDDNHMQITNDDLHAALQMIAKESNYNFETLLRHASNFKEDVLRIIFGADYPFTHNNPLVRTLHLYGIIKETDVGTCEIANPLYQRVLIDHFRPHQLGMQGAILANGHDFRGYVDDGHLQVDQLLMRFCEFVERRGREAFKVTPMPQEATGQYLLMAYLDIAVRQLGGDIFTEVPSGEGRLDIFVAYQGQRHIIETKIWRGQASYEAGLVQVEGYLESEGQQSGHYLLFHSRPNVYGRLDKDELTTTIKVNGKTIKVYFVQLGHLFDSEDGLEES